MKASPNGKKSALSDAIYAPDGKQHLWQGRWISDSELTTNVSVLGDAIEHALKQPLEIQTLLDACQHLSNGLKDVNSQVYRTLESCLRQDFQLDPQQISKDLSDLSDFMRRSSLEDKLTRELRTRDPFFFSRPEYRSNVFERWSPLGFLVHIAPTNAFSVGAYSVIEGLLTGNINFLKTGGSDPPFAQLFLKCLSDLDRTETIGRKIFACRISSRNQDMLRTILSHADGIAAWGNEDALQAVRAMAPPFARFVDWGRKSPLLILPATVWRMSSPLKHWRKSVVCWSNRLALVLNACTWKRRVAMNL